MSNIIEIRNLKKYFNTPRGKLHAVDDVSLTIEAGKTLGVVGESGCGKSTLGRTTLRLTEPTEGEIIFEGQDITKLSKKEMKDIRMKLQIIFQDPYASLNPRLSVSEIIEEPIIVGGLAKNGEEMAMLTKELMDTVGLAERLTNTYPHELDGGRRQRIGIARALATDPKFIVCDEPVSALDVSIQAQILNLMMDLQEAKGLSYMFITHDLSVVKHISNEIAVMYLGRCVERGATQEIFSNPLHPYTKALLSAIPVIDISRKDMPQEFLTGEVSSPINPPAGCRFASRCKYVSDKCRGQNFELADVGGGHFVACTLYM